MNRIPMAHRAATLFCACALLGACGSSQAPAGSPEAGTKYEADVTRTALGIPHIRARDFGSMGYAYGYSFAEDNLCVLQEDLVTIRGERARYFGRDGSYKIQPNDTTADNVSSDFFWKSQATAAVVDNLRTKALPELREATTGFADGWNRYIRELKAGGFPGRHAACRDQPWVAAISDADMYRRYFRLAVVASSSVLINEIAGAQPPGSNLKTLRAEPTPEQQAAALRAAPGGLGYFMQKDRSFGSNMYAFGKDATDSGVPMVYGNPHFPWIGTERLYISHLTIPGKLDIMGSSLYGVPAILIGFNDHVAWSHTVSTAYRFTFYELTLNPLNPTQYLYDGQIRDLQRQQISVEVQEADGSITTESRTMYRSHYGPMLVLQAAGVPVLGWSNLKAYALRDANAENDRLINQFAKWNQAGSLEEFKELQRTILGVPWVNTVASGPGSKAYYADITVVPHVSDDKVASCQAVPLHTVVNLLMPGLPVLDGSRSACEWGTDADAPAPGIFGAGNLPSIERDDFVTNCNDSYWLTNPAQPLVGYARIIGDENAERSLRTRLCTLQAQRRLAGSDGRPGNRYDMATLQEVALSSQIYSAELARDTVLSTLCPAGIVVGSSGPVDVSAACAALAAWDGKANLDSRGAHIWREFFRNLSAAPLGLPLNPLSSAHWTTPFSAADPVNTPRGLNPLLPTVPLAFADAVQKIGELGIAYEASIGELQHPAYIDPTIPIFGGEGHEGAFTIVSTGPLTASGYGVDYGNSYLQTVTWDDAGVVAEGFITYSQSTDPASPHFSDFTREYSAKHWHRFPFKATEVDAQAQSTQHLRE